MKYEISDQIKNNLLVFLQRVDLKGSEALAFVELLNVLHNPLQEEMTENK